jgi:hypothetical protein
MHDTKLFIKLGQTLHSLIFQNIYTLLIGI